MSVGRRRVGSRVESRLRRAEAPAVRSIREALGRARRELFPSPEAAAWRAAARRASRVPRFTPGEIELGGYTVGYTDLLTVCPQWWDIFVSRVLAFEAAHDRPRIIDCGANVGLATLFYKRLYPQAVITACEADPALAAICRRNMTANGIADVDVRHAAVWTSAGTIEFRCEGADAGALNLLDTGVSGATTRVPALRLRDLIAAEPAIDLLKMDIEGAEFDVLLDSADVLSSVRALQVDVHEFDPERRRMPELLRLLDAVGFRYSIDHLMPLSWRREAGDGEPFPGVATAWALLVRAWRA